MPQSVQNPAISDLETVGSRIEEKDVPITRARRLFDYGAHMAEHIVKRSEDWLDWRLDLMRWLEPDEAITGVVATALPSDLIIPEIGFTDTDVVLWMAGGKDHMRHTVRLTVTTSWDKIKIFRFVVLTTGQEPLFIFVSVETDGAQIGRIAIPETGTDPIGPLIVADPAVINFGTVELGTQSAPLTLTLANRGDINAPVRALKVTGDFAFTSEPLLLLRPGTSFPVHLTFSPATEGVRTGELFLLTGDDEALLVARLVGEAIVTATPPVLSVRDAVIEDIDLIRPALSVGPAVIETIDVEDGSSITLVAFRKDFGSVPVGSRSLSFTGRLIKGGDRPLHYENLQVTPPFYFDAAEGLPPTSGTLELAGNSVGFSLYFQPETGGVATGTLSVTSDADIVNADRVQLTGTGGGISRLKIAFNQFARVDNGFRVRLKSVNWFGAEGTNYTPHGTWARNWRAIIDQIRSFGFNTIRLPFSGDFTANGRTPPATAIDFDLNPEFSGKTALEILDIILDYCAEKGLYVVLDHHRRQAGVGADGAPTGSGYSEANWLAAWGVMATRYANHPAIVGADLHNEPHDLTWDAWASLAETCGNHILSIAPDWLIFVEGVGNIDDDHYWWGGQLKGVATRPIQLNVANKVAYSPHEYGQSVGSQPWLAYDGQTLPANWPLNLYSVWREHWGFIFEDSIAPIWIGEFGGHYGLDGSGNLTKPHAQYERQWTQELVKYLNADFNGDGTDARGPENPGMSFAYWSFNPNSGDTGGLVQDDWQTPQTPKLELIAPLLMGGDGNGGGGTPDPSPADILNIGASSGQNHFRLQVGKIGDTEVTYIEQSALSGGYEDAPYFTVIDNQAVQFQVRLDAPRTGGSQYARSELRETTASGGDMGFNPFSGTHVLHGKSRITHLPPNKPEVVVAQLHNGDRDRVAIRTQLISGKTMLLCRVNGTSSGLPRFDEDYAIGTEFEWMIRIENGTVSVFYGDMNTPLFESADLQSTGADSWYFKAGAYAQSNENDDDADEYVSVELRDLACTHA